MDLVIPIGQKNTLAEYMILFGAKNRPPMLDIDLYDSWKIRMELYMQNRENGRMILESVKHGPLIRPTIEENRSCQGSMGKVQLLIQGRQNSYAAGTSETRANTSGPGGNYSVQGNGKVLNEKELEFLADPRIAKGLVTQSVITHNATYQADELDAYDSECDEISTAKAVVMYNTLCFQVIDDIDKSAMYLLY
ncbi:hypothetical protein Tco_1340419, partial [Tanacetum coccineum]